jgi:hypothetical protein
MVGLRQKATSRLFLTHPSSVLLTNVEKTRTLSFPLPFRQIEEEEQTLVPMDTRMETLQVPARIVPVVIRIIMARPLVQARMIMVLQAWDQVLKLRSSLTLITVRAGTRHDNNDPEPNIVAIYMAEMMAGRLRPSDNPSSFHLLWRPNKIAPRNGPNDCYCLTSPAIVTDMKAAAVVLCLVILLCFVLVVSFFFFHCYSCKS